MIVPFLLALAIVIACAKLGGWLSNRVGQPAVLGELLVGLLLGPSVINLFGLPYFEAGHVGDTLHELGELGVLILMFMAGLEIHLPDLVKTGKAAVWVGVLGVFTPLVAGWLTALPFGYTATQAIFIGIVLAATSVSISAQTLMELGRLRTREGLTLLGAAVVDDILAIAILSVFLPIASGGGADVLSVAGILARIAIVVGAGAALGLWLLPRVAAWSETLEISQPITSVMLVMLLFFAWIFEAIGGVAAITGAFAAGLALSGSSLRDEIERDMRVLAYAFLVPVFLVGIGLTADLRALSGSAIGLTVIICAVAIGSKLLGSGVGARLGGMSGQEALRVGAGMVSRGEVGLIVAGIGVQAGVINTEVFTVAVVMVLVSTLVTPIMVRLAFRRD